MKNKIIFLVLLVLLCVLFYFFRPNFHFLQKLQMKMPGVKLSENTDDLSKYRDNPKKYFKIAKEKQKRNMANFCAEYENANYKYNYCRKNNFQRKDIFDKKQNRIIAQEFTINNNIYDFDLRNPEETDKVTTDNAIKTFGTNLHDIIYMWPDLTNDNIKFQGVVNTKMSNKSCALWKQTKKISTYDDVKENKQVEFDFITNYCIDEETGLTLSYDYLNTRRYLSDVLFEVTKIDIGNANDNMFLLPKSLKFVKKPIFQKEDN